MNTPAALNLKHTTDANKSWREFRQAWEVYEIASGTDKKEPLVRLATFLHVAGADALEKYNGFLFHQMKIEMIFKRCCRSLTLIASQLQISWLNVTSYTQGSRESMKHVNNL